MGLISDSDELDIFHTPPLMQIIEFKWNLFGRKHHMFGFFFHFFYVGVFIIYVKEAYMEDHEKNTGFVVALCIGVIYPALYDWT
jgi:hypothetical protein